MDRRDFFISFNSADLPHAEAINDALRDAGYRTHFHPDIGFGESRLGWMRRTLPESVQVLGLASPDYFKPEAEYSELLEVEWLMRDWVAEDPANRHFDAPPFEVHLGKT